MSDIESKLLKEIKRAMFERNLNQADFARHKGRSRGAVNPYFTGKKGLLTKTAVELLEWLGVEIRLVPVDKKPADKSAGEQG